MNIKEALITAFAGEGQAGHRYDYFASVAKEEGYYRIYQVFKEIAGQEREHGETLFKYMTGGKQTVSSSVPFPYGEIKDTVSNLKSAIEGETYEATQMYPTFAEIADKEGETEIASHLRGIIQAELHHKSRFEYYLNLIQDGWYFNSYYGEQWTCLNCGYVVEGQEPPEICPSCDHKKGYFCRKNEDIYDE